MARLNPEELRHEDHIFPYIYITYVKGLIAILRNNEEAGLICGCTIVRAPSVSYLLFANDGYLFFKSIGTEASVMKNILIWYENFQVNLLILASQIFAFTQIPMMRIKD